MEINYINWEWKPVGSLNLNEILFNGPMRKDIIARVIRWQQAKARSGTHSTKTFSMVSGTTRKPWGQKETGRARQGSLRAPHFRGGAVVFGPHPRSYEHKLNKKVRNLAFVSSLTFKLKEGLFDVLEDITMPFSKTSGFVAWMKERQFKSVLFVVSDKMSDDAIFRCIRNVPYCDILPVRGLNVLDLVKHKNIICDLTALKEIEERFSKVTSKQITSMKPAQKSILKAKEAGVAASGDELLNDSKMVSEKPKKTVKKAVKTEVEGKE